jgi:predicted regulator of Ras-like GTPase activity (Roadblock/LC7/MglB family)
MFSFFQKLLFRAARAEGEPEARHSAVAGSVTLRDEQEIVLAGHSFPRVRTADGGENPNKSDSVPLMLRTIVAGLPQNLQVAVQTPPDAQMRASIPLALIASQLPRGSVYITFAELRCGSAKGVFSSSPIFDKKRLKLPLKEILIYVKPTRRPIQKKVEMPDDIPPLFMRDGRAILRNRLQADVYNESPALYELDETREIEVMPAGDSLSMTAPSFEEECRRLKTQESAWVDRVPPEKAPMEKLAGVESLKLGSGDVKKFPYAMGNPVDLEVLKVESSAESAPEDDPCPKLLAADASLGGEQHIEVALEVVVDSFPDEIKREVSEVGADTVFGIPLAVLAPKMARGRIEFSWSQLHEWGNPRMPLTRHGAMQINLPLKEIIPLFMAAHRRPAAGSRKVIAGHKIPDVFRGRDTSRFRVVKEADSEFERTAAKLNGATVEADSVAIDEWDPRDFLEEAVSLDGVEGVIVASHDGLVVAERMPDPVDSGALAAFLPEMMGRTADYLSKAQIGTPDWMVLQVNGRMLQISKAGELCLAVLGETGRPLPRTKLRELMQRISVAQPSHQ